MSKNARSKKHRVIDQAPDAVVYAPQPQPLFYLLQRGIAETDRRASGNNPEKSFQIESRDVLAKELEI